MMKLYIYLIILAFLVFSPYMVQAETFQITAESINITSCQCETINAPITITNTGEQTQAYTITNNRNTLQQTNILRPSQSIKIPVPVRAQCANTKQTDFQVTVTNNFQNAQKLTRTITTQTCPQIEIDMSHNQIIDPCQNQTYEIKLRNLANFTDTFTANPQNNKKEFEIGAQRFTLQPNQQGTFKYETRKACEINGNFTQRFLIESELTQREWPINASYEIKDNYSFEIEALSNEYYCSETQNIIPIQITNTGAIENTANIYIERRQRQLNLQNTSVTIRPGQTIETFILIRPRDANIENITLGLNSEIGNYQTKQVIETNITSCYKNTQFEYVGENRICQTEDLPFSITNQGPQVIETNINATNLFNEPYQNQIELSPRQTFLFNITPTYQELNDIDTKNIQLEAQVTENQSLYINKAITIYPENMCAQPNLMLSANERYYETNISLAISNQGVKEATYRLIQTSTNEVINLTTDNITISPGQIKTINFSNQKGKDAIGHHTLMINATEIETGITHEISINIQIKDDFWFVRLYRAIRDFLLQPIF